MAEVYLLPKAELAWAWPRIAELVTPALKHGGDTHGPEDVRQAIDAGEAWVLCQLPIRAVVIAEIAEYPRCTMLRAWLAGADGERTDWAPYVAALEAMARTKGCRAVEIVGRTGWCRALKGFDAVMTTVRKEIGT